MAPECAPLVVHDRPGRGLTAGEGAGSPPEAAGARSAAAASCSDWAAQRQAAAGKRADGNVVTAARRDRDDRVPERAGRRRRTGAAATATLLRVRDDEDPARVDPVGVAQCPAARLKNADVGLADGRPLVAVAEQAAAMPHRVSPATTVWVTVAGCAFSRCVRCRPRAAPWV